MRVILTFSVLSMTLAAATAHASTDPVKANPNTGASFNRYSYAANNPYKFVDPDGRDIKGAGNTYQLVPIGGNLPTMNFPGPKVSPRTSVRLIPSFITLTASVMLPEVAMPHTVNA